MKYATFIMILIGLFIKSYSQNEVIYCEKTTWTMDRMGKQIDTYGSFGLLKSIRMNKFGDTTSVINNHYDTLGRIDTTWSISHSYEFYHNDQLINPYSENSDSQNIEIIRSLTQTSLSRCLYKDMHSLVLGYEFITPVSTYTLIRPNLYNEHGDEIFDGYGLYTEYMYDTEGRDSIVTEVDSLEDNKMVGHFKYDQFGQCTEISVDVFNLEGRPLRHFTNTYLYDENGNQIETKTVKSDGYIDESFNEYNKNNIMIRSYGYDNYGDEWEMLFERIPCGNE